MPNRAGPPPTAAEARRYFDEVAASWITRYEGVPSFRTRLRMVASTTGRLLESRSSTRVLDLGSGPGVLGAAASAWASLVLCVDTSWAMLHAGEVAQTRVERLLTEMELKHNYNAVVRVTGSTGALAGAVMEPFDLVLLIAVLEYQSDPHDFLASLVKLIRPSGFLLFTVPNRRSIVRIVERPFDATAAKIGRWLGRERLAARSYSSNRPFGSSTPWADALRKSGAVCREIIPLPLGDAGVRAVLRPSLLIVAEVVS